MRKSYKTKEVMKITNEEALHVIETLTKPVEDKYFYRVSAAKENIKNLVERQKPKIPFITRYTFGWWYSCPHCSGKVNKGSRHCEHCGQALDWSEIK